MLEDKRQDYENGEFSELEKLDESYVPKKFLFRENEQKQMREFII